jgi:LPXTG-motif cell wall-anchored protein
MSLRFRIFLSALILLLAPADLTAKTFRNAYVSFELADRWDCTLEQTEWVCRTNPGPTDSREAIVILTAKEVGPADTMTAYEQHLKTPRSIFARSGQPIQSRVLKVEQRLINQHPWIDGMHEASEIPNYFTRYLATTKDKIAILVTFSAHKTHYAKYSQDFFRAIESLRVIATKNLMGGAGTGAGGVGIPGADMFGSNNTGAFGMAEEMPQEGSGKGTDTVTQAAMALAVLLLVGGLYMILRKKKKKPSKKK